MLEAPCGKCENKGCGSFHDTCEKYQEFRAKTEERHEKIMSQLISNDFTKERFRSMKHNRNSNGIGRTHKK